MAETKRKIQLATGKSFVVTAVNERDSNGRYILVMESSIMEEVFYNYRKLLEEDGAMDLIQVIVDNNVSQEFTCYNKVNEVSRMLMPNGDWYLTIMLGIEETANE